MDALRKKSDDTECRAIRSYAERGSEVGSLFPTLMGDSRSGNTTRVLGDAVMEQSAA